MPTNKNNKNSKNISPGKKSIDGAIKTAKRTKKDKGILNTPVKYPIWLSIREAAKIGAVSPKTIRRAIQDDKLTFKIQRDRYLIDFASVIRLFYSSAKLKNKLKFHGLGQYISKWVK